METMTRLQIVGHTTGGMNVLGVSRIIYTTWLMALGAYPQPDEEPFTYYLGSSRFLTTMAGEDGLPSQQLALQLPNGLYITALADPVGWVFTPDNAFDIQDTPHHNNAKDEDTTV